MLIDYDKVKQFWKWFISVSDELSKSSEDDRLLKQLDGFVSTIGQDLDWEIGPVELEMNIKDDAKSYLAISPCLNEELLSKTREIIARAPDCKGWAFFPSKPVKGWTGSWNMLNELDRVISIDANEWKYILYQFDDATFDMDIWVNNVDGNLTTKYIAVDVVITNLLGEERFMNEIKNISIIKGDDLNTQHNWSLLKNLDKHLNALLRR